MGKRYLLIILIFLFLILMLFVSCNTAAVCTSDGASSITAQGSAPPRTTVTNAGSQLPTPDEIASNTYAAAGLELALTVCRQYYDLETHRLSAALDSLDTAMAWPLASYLEMLAEAYRLFPDNTEIRAYYLDALDRCLPAYLVENATVRAPSGEFYHGVTYCNAGAYAEGNYFYDDNAWICIQLLDAYRLLANREYLILAERLLSFLWTGWDDKAGGIYWERTFSQKNLCTNGPVLVAYLTAYEITDDQSYLDCAEKIYTWCYTMLRNRGGLYHAELIDPSASAFDPDNLHPFVASYDQGTMMTASALLYRITKDRRYYDALSDTAAASVGLMFEGEDSMKGNPIFKSWGIGWALRGEMFAFMTGCTRSSSRFMRYFARVLDRLMTTKDEKGHYDPYFMTGEWWPPEDMPDIGHYDREVIQPSGVATAFLLTARYQLYWSEE